MKKATPTPKHKSKSKPEPMAKVVETPLPISNPVSQFVDPKTREILSIPLSLLSTMASVLSVLRNIEALVGEKTIFGETQCSATLILQFAISKNCLTLPDIQAILNKPVQYLQIYDITLRNAVNHDVGYEGDHANHAQYLDFLLFIAEMHDPSVNHLRKKRTKYEMAYLAEYEGTYSASPEPTVSTVSWEKRVREQAGFLTRSNQQNECASGLGISYWAISMGSRCTDSRFWFLVFDADFKLNSHKSLEYTNNINTPDRNCQPDGEIIRPPFVDFCMENNLEYAGTPFYPSNKSDLKRPIHFLAQQVSVTFRNNAYQVFIPSFYRSTHIKRLLKSDFYDLQFALDRKFDYKASDVVSVADEYACPFAERDMFALAKGIRGILAKHFDPVNAYVNMAAAMSFWWVASDDFNPTLVRYERPPKKAELAKPLPRQVVMKMLQDDIIANPPSPAFRYLFDRYRGKLIELKQI